MSSLYLCHHHRKPTPIVKYWLTDYPTLCGPPYKTSSQWYETVKHLVEIYDADGWRSNIPPDPAGKLCNTNDDYFTKVPISEGEFKWRLGSCTVMPKDKSYRAYMEIGYSKQ